jgi:hypothetical protein
MDDTPAAIRRAQKLDASAPVPPFAREGGKE